MPKVSLSLQDAKAKDAEILAKLGKVQKAAQGHKQNTKLNQQRLEFAQEAKKLASEARRLETDLEEMAYQMELLGDTAEERQAGSEEVSDVWFQVAGVRKLLAQVKLRDVERLRKAPVQAFELRSVLGSVAAALGGFGDRLSGEVEVLEQECKGLRWSLRHDLGVEFGLQSVDRSSAADPELSDEEDALMDKVAAGPEARYTEDLFMLNEQVSQELAQLDQEVAELKRKRTGWNDEAHFRFMCIKRQFQGKNRELYFERLEMEFPHLSREQLQAHEAHTDALKFASQRQAAALREWRRSRLKLLRQVQGRVDERLRDEELKAERRQEMLDQRAKGKKLHAELQVGRVRARSLMEGRRRVQEEDHRRVQALEAAREEAHRRHIAAVKEQCKEIGEKKRERRRQEDEAAAERERAENEERTRRTEANSERVRIRRQIDTIKQREVSEQRAALEQEAREREDRLRRAMESLRVEAPRDPERLLKEPARNQAPAYLDPLQCVTRGPHAGFHEKQLMKDARYKISAALQAAGLYDTKAGQEVLSRVSAPRPNNPTYVSQVFAGGYPGA
eukprot:TRINITY_DN6427_c0_g1_i1.p1 TRINITY_DN6427_c0_g1~~TRINITY_DN6427_c0_g1_i1.p1  ORF type:complete len:563 (-),score=193.36 TRINITY_DN6427_c0_g1_i1:341-2029(-)